MTKKINRQELMNRCGFREDKFFAAFAKDYLTYLGNLEPTNQQKIVMRKLLSHVFLQRNIYLDMRLTDREKACLYLAAAGKSNSEIAAFFAIHKRTVELLRESIFKKLGCKKITEAITIGIRYGIIAS